MAKGKKYSYQIEKNKGGWSVQIFRQVTSRKVTTTKQQADFSSESEAREWADKELSELMKKQASRNKRHSDQRKEQEHGRTERSIHRAEKTQEKKTKELATNEDSDSEVQEESDDWSEELKLISEANSDT